MSNDIKDKIKDFSLAVTEEGITTVVENKELSEAVMKLASMITSPEAVTFVSSIFGAIAPRVNGVLIAYKGKLGAPLIIMTEK